MQDSETDGEVGEELQARLGPLYGEATGSACHQARQLLLRHFAGNVGRFLTEFLTPSVALLESVRRQVRACLSVGLWAVLSCLALSRAVLSCSCIDLSGSLPQNSQSIALLEAQAAGGVMSLCVLSCLVASCLVVYCLVFSSSRALACLDSKHLTPT